MSFPPEEQRISCSLLTRVDPFNVTFRTRTLLDMASDKRQNQANKAVKGLNRGSFSQLQNGKSRECETTQRAVMEQPFCSAVTAHIQVV